MVYNPQKGHSAQTDVQYAVLTLQGTECEHVAKIYAKTQYFYNLGEQSRGWLKQNEQKKYQNENKRQNISSDHIQVAAFGVHFILVNDKNLQNLKCIQ